MIREIKRAGQKPIKLWLNQIEEGALKQAHNLANFPHTFRHVALMPDCHQGYGMPIGGVLATLEVVIPNAVGVDIGCGMCAVPLSINRIERTSLQQVVTAIQKHIPRGFQHHKSRQDIELMPPTEGLPQCGIVAEEFEHARTQIGTLGGGNHFIEIQQATNGVIWLMIHSGSRNLGLQVASNYNQLAREYTKQMQQTDLLKNDLAYLHLASQEAQDYIKEMTYCMQFAFANRLLMLNRIKSLISDSIKNTEFGVTINIAHNYARLEKHFNQMVMVHRKGATSAKRGEVGIIPGSQGSKSYLVKGKGNPDSFNSCSHGAGRAMGRQQARRSLNLKLQQQILNQQGIIHSIQQQKDLDEAPSAYKNIQEVMHNQDDLVDIFEILQPLAVIKG